MLSWRSRGRDCGFGSAPWEDVKEKIAGSGHGSVYKAGVVAIGSKVGVHHGLGWGFTILWLTMDEYYVERFSLRRC